MAAFLYLLKYLIIAFAPPKIIQKNVFQVLKKQGQVVCVCGGFGLRLGGLFGKRVWNFDGVEISRE